MLSLLGGGVGVESTGTSVATGSHVRITKQTHKYLHLRWANFETYERP